MTRSPDPPAGTNAEVRELRSQMRTWRRGHANTRIIDALSDTYIALFAAAVLGSMVVSVILRLRRESLQECITGACLEARSMMPWLAGLAAVLLVLVLARLFGPVFVSPAFASWLMSAPLDRGALLRTRLLWSLVLATLLGSVVGATAASLGGFTAAAVVAFTGSVSVAAVAATLLATRSQVQEEPSACLLTWSLVATVWLGLLTLAVGHAPVASAPQVPLWWYVGLAVAVLIVLAAAGRVVRGTAQIRRRQVAPGGRLAPAMSGALATLDLALAHDVLLARRWRSHAPVRSRRGGPCGPVALVWLDLVRLTRSPQAVVILLAAVVVPYAVEAAGLQRVVSLIAAFTGFLAALGLCSALRVVARTPALGRMLPFSTATTRAATLAVPAVATMVFAAATAPALLRAMDTAWPDAPLLALAVGGSSTAAAVRWTTGRPPDYSRPLISSPMGAVPTNLYGSAVRGLDVLIVTSAPLLIVTTTWQGALASIVISLGVLGYLLGRE